MRTSQLLAVITFALVARMQAQSSHPPLHVNPRLKSCSIQFAPSLTQQAFRRFVREAGSATAFRQVASTSTLPKGSVSLGVEVFTFTEDEWSDAWNDTFYHPNAEHPLGSRQVFPKLKLRAGVSDNLDIGAFYTNNPEANYGWLGLDAKYRLLNETDDMPTSIAVRGAYTRTLYVSDMKMQALTADVSASRRVWGTFRPYAGVGVDGVLARETSDSVNLHRENLVVAHAFAGVDLTVLRRLTIAAEFTQGAVPSMQVQVGVIAF